MNQKIVFMGSPEFAVPTLNALMNAYNVVGIITQPDRPAGRGKKLISPPVKEVALTTQIPVIQPRRLRDEQATKQLSDWNPDLIVVVAFGQILRQNVLDLPPYGCINVHASLLPRWRGAAPIQAALYHGDPETGVTIMKMDAGIDTGPILAQQKVVIKEKDTAITLGNRLSTVGAELLINTLPGYLRDDIKPKAQPDEGATYVSMINKSEGLLDFSRTAEELKNQVRAYNSWPGTFFDIGEDRLKVHEVDLDFSVPLGMGERGSVDGFPAVGTKSGNFVIRSIQPAGKKVIPGDVFLLGYRNW